MTMNLGMNAANIYAYNTLNNLDTPIYGYNNAMSMNGSIMPSFMGMGMGINPDQQIQYMDKWNKYNVDSQVSQYNRQRSANFQMQAQDDVVSRQIQILNAQIRNNSSDKIQAEYGKLLNTIKSTYSDSFNGLSSEASDERAKAYAEKLYTQQTGQSITDAIGANSSGNFATGFKKVVSFGLCNSSSASDNIAAINGTGASKKATASKIGGYIVGGLTLLAAGLGIYKNSRAIGEGLKTFGKYAITRR